MPAARPTLSLLLTVILLTACGGASSTEQTLSARNATLGTQVADLAATATVAADRLRVTAEYAQGEISRLQTQQARMVATLRERGVPVENLPGAVTQPAATPASPGTPNTPPPQPTADIEVTPFAPTAPPAPTIPTPVGDGPALVNVVTAQDVGADDCASGVTAQFSASVPEIYVVATALNITDGTTIGSRWLRDGAELWSFELSFNRIDEACIWFFATPEDFAFAAGTYRVALSIDGQPAGETSFTIADGAPIGGEAPPGQ